MKCLTACAFIATLFLVADSPSLSADRITVTVRPDKETFLVGEPIHYQIRVHNESDYPVYARSTALEDPHSEVTVWVARNDGRFGKYTPTQETTVDIDYARSIEQFGPGQTWCFRKTILHFEKAPSKLLMPEPGPLQIKVWFPFHVLVPPTQVDLESKPAKVQIVAPEGEDAVVWDLINRGGCIEALHLGFDIHNEARRNEAEVETGRHLAETLKAHPKSTYTPAIRNCLRGFVDVHRERMDYAERARIRELIGAEPERPFMDDKRLDRIVQPKATGPTTTSEVLADLSAQAKVRLTVEGAVANRENRVAQKPHPLRDWMRILGSSPNQSWRADGTGYVLAETPEKVTPAKPRYGACEVPVQIPVIPVGNP